MSSSKTPNKYNHWKVAVEEANSLVDKTIEERLNFFEKLMNPKRKKYSVKRGTVKHFVGKSNSIITKDINTKIALEMEDSEINISDDDDDLTYVDKSSDVSNVTHSVTCKLNTSLEMDVDAESNNSLCPELNEGAKINDVDELVPTTLELQRALYKRNNLFRGVTKERVCQTCERIGDVRKCKGFCCGYYHLSCAQKVRVQKPVCKDNTMLLDEIQIHSAYGKENDIAKSGVEIVQVKSRTTPTHVALNTDVEFNTMPLVEKIDHKMKEVMEVFGENSRYIDSTTDYTSSEENSLVSPVTETRCRNGVKSHVAVDGSIINSKRLNNRTMKLRNSMTTMTDDFKCSDCLQNIDPLCFVCHRKTSKSGSNTRQKCSIFPCGKFYHPECLKVWPQTQWSLISTTKHKSSNEILDMFVCPVHVCHTCVSDNPRAAISRCTSDKVVKCLRCPATYHTGNLCVPAGTEILTATQIICPRHFSVAEKKNSRKGMKSNVVNTMWCFICSAGGDLICCESCPTSVHLDCLNITLGEDESFICEDCETGRFPLYDEVVWVKLGLYRWWPAVILYPNEVPDKIWKVKHNKGEFVVRFFGTYNYYWIGRGRVFLFQEDDTGHCTSSKRKVETLFRKSIVEAKAAHSLKQGSFLPGEVLCVHA